MDRGDDAANLEPSARLIDRPRLGQAAFHLAVTDAYARTCAPTAEHSLPVLDAAHIQPYADGGAHEIPNGLLLRAGWTMYSCTASTTPAT